MVRKELQMKFSDLLTFRSDLYFDGAVQADWFYIPSQSAKVASNFVFHGPKTHAVSLEEVNYKNLMDTASFTELLVDKITTEEKVNPFTLAIAGYGTGKSHMAVALSELFSGSDFHPDVYSKIIQNISRADQEIGTRIRQKTNEKNLVLTLNGMNKFDLHYELLRTAQKALKLYNVSDEVIRSLDQAHETAMLFLQKNFYTMQEKFEHAAAQKDINLTGESLYEFIFNNSESEICFELINEVYLEINGHMIRWDEGVSAKQILSTLVHECCGTLGDFDRVVILFDEFGRFLEYASANPGKAGDSALQQIFEACQNAEGEIQFIGFIQADIKAYLQRVDKTSNVSRYIDRFDASEKIYISSNLETIFANLIEPVDILNYQQIVGSYFISKKYDVRNDYDNLSRWLNLSGVWSDVDTFTKYIHNELYPLHPMSTYLLTSLTDWLQNRSSLTLLNEQFEKLKTIDVTCDCDLPVVYPVDLLNGNFFLELLDAEESGRQRSQVCILYNTILKQYGDKFSEAEKLVLLSNVILRICRFKTISKEDTILALSMCSNLTVDEINKAIKTLENEFAVLEYDSRANCFDFIADAVGAGEYRSYMRKVRNGIQFNTSMLENNEEILELLQINIPIETTFGAQKGIQTLEWSFNQVLLPIEKITDAVLELYINKYKKSISTDVPKGWLIWAYFNKDTDAKYIDALNERVASYCLDKPIVVFALNDAENILKDSVVNYLSFNYVDDYNKSRFERFFEEDRKKAEEALFSQFEQLKKERQYFSGDGIEISSLRMTRYLSEIFEKIYPMAIPFDFENFKKKTKTKAKTYCSLVKMIAGGGSSQVLKVQGGELKSRFDSVLRLGEFSWQSIDNNFLVCEPKNAAVKKIYSLLESRLHEKGYLEFADVLEELYAPPYGLNEYSATLLLLILSLNLSYCTKLVVDNQRYNNESWSQIAFSDTKIEMKSVIVTRLIKVDIAAAQQRYMALFNRIENNTDIFQVEALENELNDLQKQEELPDELNAHFQLAIIRLGEGKSAYQEYDKNIGDVKTNLNLAIEHMRVDSFLYVIKQIRGMQRHIQKGRTVFVLSDEAMNEFKKIEQKAEAYFKKYWDTWLVAQRCSSLSELVQYEKHMKKTIKVLHGLGYESEARAAISLLDKELASKEAIRTRALFTEQCASFLSRVKGLSEKTSLEVLDNYLLEGNQLKIDYAKFNINDFSKKQNNEITACLKRIDEIDILVKMQSKEMAEIWDAIYEVSTLYDLKTICTRIEAILNKGVPKKDREDFENILAFMNEFLHDIDIFNRLPDERTEIEENNKILSQKYDSDEAEFDVSEIYINVYKARVNRLNDLEQTWINTYLNIDVKTAMPEKLQSLKVVFSQLPLYLSNKTLQLAEKMMQDINRELSNKRVAYIISQFKELTEEEKQSVINQLGLKR